MMLLMHCGISFLVRKSGEYQRDESKLNQDTHHKLACCSGVSSSLFLHTGGYSAVSTYIFSCKPAASEIADVIVSLSQIESTLQTYSQGGLFMWPFHHS